MILNLLIGFPGERPGGLLLSVLTALGSGACALAAGMAYAAVCVHLPRAASMVLQLALAVLRGVPLLLLVFLIAQVTTLPLAMAGLLALFVYSLCHVGEVLRGFLAAYPTVLRDQARLLGLGWLRELGLLRLPWTLLRSLDALATHWISLLKDTGALVVLGIGELTTVAKVMSERSGGANWQLILILAAAMYLVTVVALTRALEWLKAAAARPGGWSATRHRRGPGQAGPAPGPGAGSRPPPAGVTGEPTPAGGALPTSPQAMP